MLSGRGNLATYSNFSRSAVNIYVYFRTNERKTVMVVFNANSTSKKINIDRFKENLKDFSKAKDIISRATHLLSELTVPFQTTLILELN